MEVKKSVKLKSKVDWKRVVKLSLISVALLLLVVLNVVSAVGGRDERADSGVVAYADSVAVPTGNELDYYFVIPSGSVIGGYDRCIIDDNVGCISLNLYLGETLNSYYRYSYAVWYRTNSIPTSVHGQPFLELSNNYSTNGTNYTYTVLTDFVVYLNSNIIELLGNRFPNSVKLLSFSITYNSTSYSGWSISGLSNELLPIYSIPSYQLGYDNGYDNGYDTGYNAGINANISALTPVKMFLAPVQAFFDVKLFGIMSLGDVLSVGIFVAVAIIFLKMFSGG